MVAVAPRLSESQPNPTQVVGLNGWMGGLNWASDPAHVHMDELLECVNLDIAPDGGLRARKRWTRGRDLSSELEATGPGSWWQPLNAGVHDLRVRSIMWQAFPNNEAPGPPARMLVAGRNSGGAWAQGQASYADNLVVFRGYTRCGFDSAQWDYDTYFAIGIDSTTSRRPGKINADDILHVIPLAEANLDWDNDYRDPPGGKFIRANTIASHMGYMFAGGVKTESDTNRFNRLRWSHPSNPEAWAQKDFLDVFEGGEEITHIESFEDHLVIFKDASIWALFGYSPSTWELREITREMGVESSMAVTQGAGSVWFANKLGVWRYDSNGVEEVSSKIKGLFSGGHYLTLDDPWGWNWAGSDDNRFDAQNTDWEGLTDYPNFPDSVPLPQRFAVSWVDSRLWVSVGATIPGNWTDNSGLVRADWQNGDSNPYPNTYVYDPFRGDGVWTEYRGHNDNGVGRVVFFRDFPFDASGGLNGADVADRGDRYVAFNSMTPLIVVVEDATAYRIEHRTMIATPNLPTEEIVYWFRTNWIHGGNPALKKRFRRTDIVMQSDAWSGTLSTPVPDIYWNIYSDFELKHGSISRSGYILPPSGGSFSVPFQGVRRTPSLGTRHSLSFLMVARSEFESEHTAYYVATGDELQVASLIFKFVPRRLV